MTDMYIFRVSRAAFDALAAEIRADYSYGPESWLDAAHRRVGSLADARLLALLGEPQQEEREP